MWQEAEKACLRLALAACSIVCWTNLVTTHDTCPDEDALIAFAAGEGRPALEVHLADCERCRLAVAHFVTGPPSPRRASFGSLTTVGRYQVVRLVGEGAMGRVYVAFDALLDRNVALKMLHALGESAEARTALLREAQALARLSHPNLVSVYDAGVADGTVFIAMELVTGVTLRAWCAAQPRTPSQVLAAFVQAALGLVAVHEAGLIHRDFKADNVLVGDDGRVRVSDFGLAQRDGEREVRRAGTPAYMAPEQLAGGAVDARADQFAWCCALAEALTGARPFVENSAEAVSKGAALRGVERRVAKVLRRGLQADPAQRFATMQDLLRQLEPSRVLQRGGMVLLSLVALATVAGLSSSRQAQVCRGGEARVAAVFGDTRRQQLLEHFRPLGETEARGVAAALGEAFGEWQAAFRDNCEATRVRKDQSDMVFAQRSQCLERRLIELQASLEVLETAPGTKLDRAIDVIGNLTPISVCAANGSYQRDSDRPENPHLAERVEALDRDLATAIALYESGQLDEATAAATRLAEAARALPWPSREAEAVLLLGRIKRFLNEPFEEPLRDAYAKAIGARDDALTARIASCLGDLFSQRGKLREAGEWNWHAAAFRARLPGDDELIELIEGQAGFLSTEPGGARAHNEAAVAAALRLHGEHHPHVAKALFNLGTAASGEHHRDEAIALKRRAAAIEEAARGPNHPSVARSWMGLADELIDDGKVEEAQQVLDRLLPFQLAHFGADSTQVALLLQPKVRVLALLGRHAEALTIAERVLAIFQAHQMPRESSWTLIDAADQLSALGRYDDALARFAQARALLLETFGEDDSDLIVVLESECHADLDNHQVRQAVMRCAEAVRRRQLQGDLVPLGLTRSILGQAHLAAGAYKLAATELAEAVTSLEASGYDERELAIARAALVEARTRLRPLAVNTP